MLVVVGFTPGVVPRGFLLPLVATLAKNAIKLAFADLQDLASILAPPIPFLQCGKNDQEAAELKNLVKASTFDVR